MAVAKKTVDFDDFYRLDLRVAKIVWAAKIDGAERLLKLTLDVGELGLRTVVSPLRPWYTPEKLVGKRVVYLANGVSKRIRGITSRGMLVTASPYDKQKEEFRSVLLVPDGKAPAGTILR